MDHPKINITHWLGLLLPLAGGISVLAGEEPEPIVIVPTWK